jgi:hypothetical protein
MIITENHNAVQMNPPEFSQKRGVFHDNSTSPSGLFQFPPPPQIPQLLAGDFGGPVIAAPRAK